MHATCIPRHNLRYGTSCSKAYKAALIFPSTPRAPNPPGTTIPSSLPSTFAADALSSSSAFTHIKSKFTLLCAHAAFSASVTQIYVSSFPTYFATNPTFTVFANFVARAFEYFFHALISGSISSPIKSFKIGSTPLFSTLNGTSYTESMSGKFNTASDAIPENAAIFSQIARAHGFSVRTHTISGMIPNPRKSFKAFCAGLVFSSFEVLIHGTYTTDRYKQFRRPTLFANSRIASINGSPS